MDPQAPLDLLAHFTPEDLARGAARARLGHLTGSLELALDLALLWALTFSSRGRALWDRCAAIAGRVPPGGITRVLGPGWAAGALFLATAALLRELVAFPLVLARDHYGAHHFGVSHEPLASFLRRWAIEAVIVAVAFALLGAAMGAVRRRWPKRWWAAVGAGAAVLLVADAIAEPLWMRLDFEPKPLEAGALRTRLETLARDHGAELGELLVIDASRYGSRANAFVTGFGPSQALVLTDTLVAFGEDAVAGAVAHEIGHRRPERLPTRLAIAAAALVALLFAIERAFAWSMARGARSEAHAMPSVVLALTVLSLVVSPLRAAFGRAEEREADALELTVRRDYEAYIAEQVRLVRANASDPAPSAVEQWLASHPAAAERIARALWYKERMGMGGS